MGFAYGFGVGSRVGDSWVDNYKKSRDEAIESRLFSVAQNLKDEGMVQQQKDAMMGEGARLFSGASADDFAGELLRGFASEGGKVDDNTARLAYKVGDTIVGYRDNVAKYFEDRKLFNAKMKNYESMINSRNVLNAQRRGGGSNSKLFSNLLSESEGDNITKPYNFVQFAQSKGYLKNSRGSYPSDVYKAFDDYLFYWEPKNIGGGSNTKTSTNGGTNAEMLGISDEEYFADFPRTPKKGEQHEAIDGAIWEFDGNEWVPVKGKSLIGEAWDLGKELSGKLFRAINPFD